MCLRRTLGLLLALLAISSGGPTAARAQTAPSPNAQFEKVMIDIGVVFIDLYLADTPGSKLRVGKIPTWLLFSRASWRTDIVYRCPQPDNTLAESYIDIRQGNAWDCFHDPEGPGLGWQPNNTPHLDFKLMVLRTLAYAQQRVYRLVHRSPPKALLPTRLEGDAPVGSDRPAQLRLMYSCKVNGQDPGWADRPKTFIVDNQLQISGQTCDGRWWGPLPTVVPPGPPAT
jgi:hypothetical protein